MQEKPEILGLIFVGLKKRDGQAFGWINTHVFGKGEFWLTDDAPVRDMLRLNPMLFNLLRRAIRYGIRASFWYDYWTELGPLITITKPTRRRDFRILIDAAVGQTIMNGN
ncbi:hypothetical protein YC2023_053422 [Brassica napus]